MPSPFNDNLTKLMNEALQGKVNPILDYLFTISDISLTSDELNFKRKFLERFQDRILLTDQIPSKFISDLVAAYHNYWYEVLTDIREEKQARSILLTKLIELVKNYDISQEKNLDRSIKDINHFDQIEEIIKKIAKQLGYFVLMGTTWPYAELMVWTNQTEQEFSVTFFDGEITLPVVFLNNFISRGWLNFATLSRMKAGGWADKEKIYRIDSKSNQINTEEFKIDILYHEGRHFLDYKLFPKLKQSELEYRSKLTELIYAEDTLYTRIANFIRAAKDNPKIPHSYAAFHVIKDLSKEIYRKKFQDNVDAWNSISKEIIHRTSQLLITRNTQWLKRNNPENIETFLEEKMNNLKN